MIYPVLVGHHRIHHGAIGAALTVIGLALAFHDRADVRRWLPDLIRWRGQ